VWPEIITRPYDRQDADNQGSIVIGADHFHVSSQQIMRIKHDWIASA